jgi:hypothetical protein
MTTYGRTYVVGNGNIDTKLSGQPLSERLETAADHGKGVSQSLQCTAELTGTLGDLQDGLQLLKHVCGDAAEQTNALLQRGREVQLAVHGALGDFLSMSVASIQVSLDKNIRKPASQHQ